MKNKIYIALLTAIFTAGHVFAQEAPEEVTPTPDAVIPSLDIVILDPNDVIPAEAGTQDEESSTPETFELKDSETNLIQEPIIDSITTSDLENIILDPVVVTGTSTQTVSTSTSLVVESGDNVRIFIRNGATVVLDTYVDTSYEESISVTDMNGVAHQISAQSVLAYLIKADKESSQFDITKLQYFDGFGSFYLKCVSISGTEYCDSWQYLVNNFSPWTGIDQTPVNADYMI